MTDKTALPQKKIRLLGNLLLVVACLGLIAVALLVWSTLSISSPGVDPELEFPGLEQSEIEELELDKMWEEILLPEGITGETTVRELLEKDRTFFDENLGSYRALYFLLTAFILVFSVIFLCLALAWRRAEPFGRTTIIGLRWLGALLIVRFFVAWGIEVFVPRAPLSELFFHSDSYEIAIDSLVGGGPILSVGLLFLILSWVLDYGRNIKEEQALTI